MEPRLVTGEGSDLGLYMKKKLWWTQDPHVLTRRQHRVWWHRFSIDDGIFSICIMTIIKVRSVVRMCWQLSPVFYRLRCCPIMPPQGVKGLQSFSTSKTPGWSVYNQASGSRKTGRQLAQCVPYSAIDEFAAPKQPSAPLSVSSRVFIFCVASRTRLLSSFLAEAGDKTFDGIS